MSNLIEFVLVLKRHLTVAVTTAVIVIKAVLVVVVVVVVVALRYSYCHAYHPWYHYISC